MSRRGSLRIAISEWMTRKLIPARKRNRRTICLCCTNQQLLFFWPRRVRTARTRHYLVRHGVRGNEGLTPCLRETSTFDDLYNLHLAIRSSHEHGKVPIGHIYTTHLHRLRCRTQYKIFYSPDIKEQSCRGNTPD